MICYTQFNLREAILGHNVEYRKTYLAALATVLFRGESSVWQPLHWTAPRDEPVLPDCVNLLLGDLEDQRCGSEFLSEALCAASLLLSQWPDSRLGLSHISTLSCFQSFPSLTLF